MLRKEMLSFMIELSVIIPHYNSVKSLQRLVDSIPAKDEVEVIVVDDVSSEGLDELQALQSTNQSKQVKLFENDTGNKGAGACRNIGLQHAQGKWVLFADSDDFFVGDFYQHVRKFFASDYEVVFFKPTSVEVDTGEKSDRHLFFERLTTNFLEKKDLKSETYLRYSFSVPWSKLIRRDFLLQHTIGFDEVLVSNDVMFSTEVGYHMEKFHVSNEIIYCVTRNRGSLTTKTSVQVYDTRLMVFINYHHFLRARLSKREWKLLNLDGRQIFLNAIKYRFSVRKILSVYLQLRRNKVKVLDSKFVNPFFVLKRSYTHYAQYKKEKRYLVK